MTWNRTTSPARKPFSDTDLFTSNFIVMLSMSMLLIRSCFSTMRDFSVSRLRISPFTHSGSAHAGSANAMTSASHSLYMRYLLKKYQTVGVPKK